ncbi:MAG: protein phosphatase 2C domain-containing protein [Actinomyces urogenitalis]|uniref:PP2C family protein-serine/threonine phosphatase n=1 Tax=Actinomyces urogenitalis TaxID=103621 RepID=UPI00242B9701|nr:protein phosphatase 2C domain-containing protein [Actinomyces urogenitalis]MCI7457964.1 protein phosphatase 2C domain-containing protein [Actinomyces urogenitalis]MDY3678098.1 protein phosphatase 2C domain-containing protein [Actinomyces urogenitalis]
MTISLRYAARSSVGLVRASNQDSAYAGPHLMAMCDGMGGPAGGDIASAVAISHLIPLDADSHQAGELLGLLRGAIQEAHADLVARSTAEPDLAGLGTTCVAVMRSGNKLAMVHVGDSRAYLLREGELTQVTTDHTFVEYLVETGRLTREQARQHPQRSVLLRVLGDADGEVQLDESIREAVPGDRWLLCSDGLSGPVTAATIGEVLAGVEDPALAADQLIDLAERAGGPDNITAVVFDVVEDDPTPQMEPQVVGSASVHRERLAADGVSAAPVPATPAAKAAALVAGLEADSEASATSPDSAQEEALAAEAERHRSARRRHRLRTALASLAVLVALVVAGVSGYMWTQTQYYVTTADGKVAIFQGIPQTLGPFSLSHLVQTYNEPALADLDERMLERLEETVAQPSLVEARKYVRETVSARVTEEATATPSPTDQMATSDPVEVTPPPTDAATGQ